MALAFAQAGAASLFLVARNEQKLAETAELVRGLECKAHTYSIDLSRADVVMSFAQILQVS